MTLAELLQEVYNLTGRPDRTVESLAAVKAATLKAHQSDYYYKDLSEAGLTFPSAEYVQNLDYRALLPRWRALKYLRKYDITSDTPGAFLTLILPEMVLDRYNIQKTDICYTAGAYVQINSSTQEQNYLLGCYLQPDITDLTYTSWVAVDHPYAIVFDAAATVFKAIGKDEEAAAYRNLVSEQIAMVRGSNIVGNGF